MKNTGLKPAKLLKNAKRLNSLVQDKRATLNQNGNRAKMSREGHLKTLQNPRFQVNNLATEDPASK